MEVQWKIPLSFVTGAPPMPTSGLANNNKHHSHWKQQEVASSVCFSDSLTEASPPSQAAAASSDHMDILEDHMKHIGK